MGIQKSEAVVTLLRKGLDYSTVEESRDQLQRRLADAQRAQAHLAGILNIVVGTCGEPNCGAPMTLHDFVFQRCRNGHFGRVNLLDEFRSAPGLGNTVVAGLAIFGAVVAANHLLGGGSD